MKRFLFMTLMVGLAITVSAQQKYPWQNPQLPRAERVESLIGMLTPEERVTEIAQMLSGSDISQAAIENARTLLDNAK